MIDKNLWKKSFSGYLPRWPCPRCITGRLILDGKIISKETGPSKSSHDEDGWDPEWVEERFVALMKCNNLACGEVVSVAGNAHVEMYDAYDEDGSNETKYGNVFSPVFIEPAPSIFLIPKQCNHTVTVELKKSFRLFWADNNSSASRLRVAVEKLLDVLKIKKFTIDNKGKKKAIALHDRLVNYGNKNKDAAALLLAIKWLGNFGSHNSKQPISREDLLMGFEFMELTIEVIFVKSHERVKKMAAKINKKKGPLKSP